MKCPFCGSDDITFLCYAENEAFYDCETCEKEICINVINPSHTPYLNVAGTMLQ